MDKKASPTKRPLSATRQNSGIQPNSQKRQPFMPVLNRTSPGGCNQVLIGWVVSVWFLKADPEIHHD